MQIHHQKEYISHLSLGLLTKLIFLVSIEEAEVGPIHINSYKLSIAQ